MAFHSLWLNCQTGNQFSAASPPFLRIASTNAFWEGYQNSMWQLSHTLSSWLMIGPAVAESCLLAAVARSAGSDGKTISCARN